MTNSVIDLLEDVVERCESGSAIKDSTCEYSWGQVLDRVEHLASGLIRLDNEIANKRMPIPVFIDKKCEAIIAFWAIAYTGNFYVPLDVKMPMDRIKRILTTLRAECIISDRNGEKILEAAEISAKVVCIEELSKGQIEHEKLSKCRDQIVDTDPLYAIFTSGSTGNPKGVVCCHKSVINYSEWVVGTFHFDENTICGNQTPFFFSMSVLDIYATLRCGGQLVIIPQELFLQPKKLIDCLNEENVNVIYWVPSALCIFSKLRVFEKYRIDKIKKVLFAGEVMPTKQLNYWRKHCPNTLFANLFGPTEITDIGVYYVINKELQDSEPIPIGGACQNVGILVLNANNEAVGVGEIGELYYRGSFLGMGYYNDWEKTRETYIQNPLNNSYPEVVYRSGDLVKYNEKGELLYVGRKDSQIKHHGYRIEIGEIESAIATVDIVDRVCCFLDGENDKIVAAVSLQESADNDSASYISAKIAEIIPSYMHPNKYIFMDEMPLNSNGKIDRKSIVSGYNAQVG